MYRVKFAPHTSCMQRVNVPARDKGKRLTRLHPLFALLDVRRQAKSLSGRAAAQDCPHSVQRCLCCVDPVIRILFAWNQCRDGAGARQDCDHYLLQRVQCVSSEVTQGRRRRRIGSTACMNVCTSWIVLSTHFLRIKSVPRQGQALHNECYTHYLSRCT